MEKTSFDFVKKNSSVIITGLIILFISYLAYLKITNDYDYVHISFAVFCITGTVIAFIILKKQDKEFHELNNLIKEKHKTCLLNNGVENNLHSVENLVESLENVKEFVNAIGEGKYAVELKGINASNLHLNQGNLTGELFLMREKMIKIAEEEKDRNWINVGLAKFADIIRSYQSDPEQLSYNFLSQLVNYVGANQGGVFILNDNDPNNIHLELQACYAYQKKRFVEKNINLKEGLVGQCFLEKSTILLTEIPENYIQITSGLGETTPNCILLVPMKNQEEISGVIELASFKIFQPFQIDFIEKIAGMIGSTINQIKISIKTKVLLEDSLLQSETLRAQEEEMRQNMEELQATQEELERKNKETLENIQQQAAQEEELRQNMEELSSVQEEIERQLAKTAELKQVLEHRENVFNITTILSESDIYGTLTYANPKLCEISKYTSEELIGQPHNIFRHPEMPKALFRLMWQTIKKGEVFRGTIKNRCKDGTHYWVDAAIMPVKDKEGKIIKYIGARYHIQNDEMAEYMYKKQCGELFTETDLIENIYTNGHEKNN